MRLILNLVLQCIDVDLPYTQIMRDVVAAEGVYRKKYIPSGHSTQPIRPTDSQQVQ